MKSIYGFLIFILLATGLPGAARADSGTGSDGAVFTVALLGAVIGVLIIVGVISDIDYFSQRASNEAMVNAADVLKSVPPEAQEHYGMRLKRAAEPKAEFEVAGEAGLGLRVRF